MDWIEFAAAMALFLASHRLPALMGAKGRLTQARGSAGYVAVFSTMSLLLLVWVIGAAGRAPFVPLWDQQPWHRLAANAAMPLAIALAVFGIGAPNPFAFEGRARGFDPARPGIAGVTRQPLLWALALWSGVHLLPNGDLAHVLLFVPFLVLALAGMPMVERRRRSGLGEAEWARLSARTGLVPFGALLAGRWRPARPPSAWRSLVAILSWAAAWYLHEPLIGVWPGL